LGKYLFCTGEVQFEPLHWAHALENSKSADSGGVDLRLSAYKLRIHATESTGRRVLNLPTEARVAFCGSEG